MWGTHPKSLALGCYHSPSKGSPEVVTHCSPSDNDDDDDQDRDDHDDDHADTDDHESRRRKTLFAVYI